MADATNEFVLIDDDDWHWYVCPASRKSEADAYFQAVDQYEDGPDESLTLPERPEWLEPVGGAPSRVKFTGYVIE